MKLTYPPQEIDVEKRNDGTLILSSPKKLEQPEINIHSKLFVLIKINTNIKLEVKKIFLFHHM